MTQASAGGALHGKVAIVTGASRGIGAAIARAFAREGAKVVLASRKAPGLEAVAAEIREAGGEAVAHPCHMGREAEVDALVAGAVERHGRLDVLVNNAATNPYFGPLIETPWAAWDKTFEVNLKGYFAAARAAARRMVAQGGGGSIINNASMVGLIGAPLQGVYAMTKAAVISMTKTLAVELGPAGVRVNALAPGLIETRFASAIVSNDLLRKTILDRTPLGRVGQPDDIAGAALLLASDAGAYITGHTLVVDGGMTIS